jgi:hypothetical protein
MTRLRSLQVACAAAVLLCGGFARGEVQKFINPCDGQKLCASYRLALTPPDGWTLDTDATAKNNVKMLVPKGKTFATAPALIYVQIFYHPDKQQTLADFARVSNERWLANVSSAKVSELPDVDRGNGQPGFLRFAFDNPKDAQQAYEIGSFGVVSDKDGNEFVLDVVITGRSKDVVDRAEKDYLALLKSL